ncbi:hypothetical protein MHU86_976 [Fragilaria crotonensis]|nr:hypothetical protein MHU86_976 [Fragilaria crotonensis]
MTVRHALSLWALIGGTFALEHGGYRIIANRQSSAKRDLGFEIDTKDLSFDGSLQDLYQLAAEKAKKMLRWTRRRRLHPRLLPVTASPTAGVNVTASPVTAAPTLVPSSSALTTKAPVSGSPVTASPTTPAPTSRVSDHSFYNKPIATANKTTVIDCETAYDSVDEISFRYAMEYESNYDITDLIAALEPMMNSHIAMVLLPCDVAQFSGGFCGATFKRNTCRVVEGQMRYFVGSGGDRTAAGFDVRSFNCSFAFAGVAFVVSIGVAFWFRCHKERRANRDNLISGESEVTVAKEASQAVLNIDTMDSGSIEDNETLSPFSKMLPAAYRLDDGQADMSVILESVEGSSTNDRGSSILLSEGYTTDEGESDGVDNSHLNFSNYSSAPVLGAKPRGEIQSLVDV